MWVRAGRIHAVSDVGRILTENVGFYRPVVTATFALDDALFGLSPFPYALTNFALLLLCAALIVRLGRALGLAPVLAIAPAALWAFNFHGVNMALLWISGRTALLLCTFALLAMRASMRGRWWIAAAWCLLAVLSKEEAVVLPLVMVLWAWDRSGDGSSSGLLRVTRRALPVFAALALYFALRLNSGAFGPLSAPSYYQPTLTPGVVLRNVAEYLDRAVSFAGAAVILVWLATRVRPSFSAEERQVLRFCGLWFVAGFALTVFLPVRSSLYALLPSIGSCLAAGVMLQALHRAVPVRTLEALAVMVVLPFVLLPVYRVRNQRWVEPADVSRAAVADLSAAGTAMQSGTHVVAIESGNDDVDLDSVFGGLFADAVTLYVDRRCTGEIADGPSPRGLEGRRDIVVLRFENGRLRRAATTVPPIEE
jgi:hypothetical protein